MSETTAPDRVFAVLANSSRPLKAKDVGAALGLSADERGAVRDALRVLLQAGRIVQLEGRRFAVVGAVVDGEGGNRAPAGARGGVPGVVQRKASGVGWFVPDDRTHKDAFLPPAELKAVMDGDRVLARLQPGPRGPMATIVRVVSQGRTSVTGLFRTSHDRRFGPSAWVEVDDNALSGPVRIVADGPTSTEPDIAADGDVVEVQIVEPPTSMHPATGRVLRRIGRRGELDTEVERLIVAAGVVRPFPALALADAGQLGDDPGEDDLRGRLDLRDLAIVTIDGETAKDFDDAVFASQTRRGGAIDVVVCVADVSHYVTVESALDREARRRSTSIYYPGRVIPMLPETLSNGLCSLKPRVPRLCAVVRFSVDGDGHVANERFDFGVMKSRARLTYSLVQRFLDEEDGVDEPYIVPPQPKEATPTTAALDDEVRSSLRLLREAALRLRKNRVARGSLDFELPELVIELDPRREPRAIKPLKRAFAHKLIEDLMIAANEASARFFAGRDLPSVYRIHELPDEEKLGRFLGLAGPAYALATGRQLPKSLLDDPTQPQALMSVMGALGDHPSRQALDMLLLRSMKQARYSIDNVGHYGLGSTAYLHFTSPIRRYPDLVVHRLLREQLGAKKSFQKAKKRRAEDAEPADALVSELEDIAATASEAERKASDLERSIQQLHACWLMKDRVGETHEAVVTGVSEAGAFVRLTELFVEGLVRISELGPEFYAYDETRLLLRGERSGEQITLGTRFDVEVADVDLGRRQIAFVRPREFGAHGATRMGRSSARAPAWEPRTDARPHGAPGMQGRQRDRSERHEEPAWRGGRDDRRGDRGGPSGPARGRDGGGAAGRRRTDLRATDHPDDAGARRRRGHGEQTPFVDDQHPRDRGRHSRFAQYADDAREQAHRRSPGDIADDHRDGDSERVAHGRATPRRPDAPETSPHDDVDARLARWRAVAETDRAITRDRRQQRYDRQQRGSRTHVEGERAASSDRPRPVAGERPRLRGPDDLRVLVESGHQLPRGGRRAHDDDAENGSRPARDSSRASKKGRKKKPPKKSATRQAAPRSKSASAGATKASKAKKAGSTSGSKPRKKSSPTGRREDR